MTRGAGSSTLRWRRLTEYTGGFLAPGDLVGRRVYSDGAQLDVAAVQKRGTVTTLYFNLGGRWDEGRPFLTIGAAKRAANGVFKP